MPSIRKTSRRLPPWVPGVASLVVASLLIGWAISHLPPPPVGPRFVGADDPTPRSGGIFVFAEGSNLHTMDPALAYDTLSTAACRLLFDALLDYDYDGNMIPSLAETMPEVSDDGRVFRFTLRPGVQFHDGEPLTADDVAWTMHRLLSKRMGSPGYPFFQSILGAPAYHEGRAEQIEGIRVLDPRTIEFELVEPDQTFLNAMAMPFASPLSRASVEPLEAALGLPAVGRNPVGTGPFKFRRWEPGVQVEFDRFDAYWNPRPRPDQMVFMENLTRDVSSARFRNGDLDVIYRPSKVSRLFLRESPAWAPYITEVPAAGLYALGLNTDLAPFDNVHVRRAVAYAIDRDKLARLEPGTMIPATQVLPPTLSPYDPQLPEAQHYDLERAKEEMRLAGYPDGIPEPVTMWTRSEREARYGLLFQQDLKAIGINLEIKLVTFATYLKETGRPRVAQSAFTGWHQDFPDPSNFMDPLFHSRAIHPENSSNRTFYRNREFDELLDRGRAEIDKAKRLEIYAEANAILASDAPWVCLFYPVETFGWQPYVKNFKPHPVWLHEYRNVWLDLPRKRVSQDIYASEEAH